MAKSPLVNIMVKAVSKASKGLVRDFGEIEKLQVSKKGTSNYVTSADLRTEKLLMEELLLARPKFGFLTEESGVIAGKEDTARFVIDPIDGTTNFIHAIPYVCISVAAQQRNAAGEWETHAGVIYDPLHDELFVAEKGAGATVNDFKLRASQRKEDLLISTSSPRKWRNDYDEMVRAFCRVTDLGTTVRCSGSAALDLAYVAAGRLDGTWYSKLNMWDMAAGILMVQEAGGMVTAMDGSAIGGNEPGSILATNGLIHGTLKSALSPR
jgi:myo-inositol-1(or 4)-monophosphatase